MVRWSNGYDFCLTLSRPQKVPSSILGRATLFLFFTARLLELDRRHEMKHEPLAIAYVFVLKETCSKCYTIQDDI
jgi:hypothetical protein